VGVKYGLLTAQLALALSGQDREDVLARLLELVAQRELGAAGGEDERAATHHHLDRPGNPQPFARRLLPR